MSRPAWGAWIETPMTARQTPPQMSRPAWGAWIETTDPCCGKLVNASRPAWGAWIETSALLSALTQKIVAPRMGRVD